MATILGPDPPMILLAGLARAADPVVAVRAHAGVSSAIGDGPRADLAVEGSRGAIGVRLEADLQPAGPYMGAWATLHQDR